MSERMSVINYITVTVTLLTFNLTIIVVILKSFKNTIYKSFYSPLTYVQSFQVIKPLSLIVQNKRRKRRLVEVVNRIFVGRALSVHKKRGTRYGDKNYCNRDRNSIKTPSHCLECQ